MAATADSKIRERLEGIMKSDRENLDTLESMIATNDSATAREITQKYAEAINQMMDSSDLTLYDKFFQLELCKHQQTMTGLVVHKAAQSLSDELQNAVEPLNEINFENRAHQEILKGVLYFVGTREIAGKEPDMGLWASIEQGVAALKGAVGSAVS
ncbi:MAG: hemerythrin HHE cation-binding protein [Cyanobacteria bacterium P01_C01_bin.120]